MNARYYRALLGQPRRLAVMDGAIRACVEEGDVVVEVGTGVGTYALMAARAGASVVYAVEPGRVSEAARRIVRANGMEDRVVFLKGRGEEVELPEPADVLITEDFSPWFYDGHLNELLLQARPRLLKPSGRTLPRRVGLEAVPWGGPPPSPPDPPPAGTVHDPRWRLRAGGGDLDLEDVQGLDLSLMEGLAANALDPGGIPPEGPLSEPVTLMEWDLAVMEEGSYEGEGRWTIRRDGRIWGLGLWMEIEWAPGRAYSNAPESGEASWGQGHLPVTPPLEVREGAVVRGGAAARSDPSGRVWWSWHLRVEGEEERVREGNTFRSLPLEERRRGLARDRRLPLSRWAAADAFLLEQLTRSTLGEAARAAAASFPGLFRDTDHAEGRAARLRERYLQLPAEEE
ncbi:MAG: hypothetical protein R6W82_03905 [bacterium]